MGDLLAEVALQKALDTAGVQRLALHSCLEIHRVAWPRCYLALDGGRMLCWYQALDAESVRLVLRQQEATDALVWPTDVIGTPVERTRETPEARVIAVVHLDETSSASHQLARASAAVGLACSGSALSLGFLTEDNRRLFLVVEAKGATAVRQGLQSAGLEVASAWPCLEIDPRPPVLFEAYPASVQDPLERSRPYSNTDQVTPVLSNKTAPERVTADLDALIIGAGIGGICALQRFLKMDLSVKVFDSATGVGGVWHWNRYPGARVDSETYSYGFSFSDELFQDWHWQELFSSQAELHRYLQHVVSRFDLGQHICLDTTITAACYDDHAGHWLVDTSEGARITAHYLIAATGALSIPQMPDFPGIDRFAGDSHHTARWPEAGVELAGKRVGVVGTGSSGVQVIQTIAEQARHLTVFQRTPTYCIPQRNRRLTEQDQRQIRFNREKTLAACRESFGGFIHNFDPRSGLAVTAREREEKFEALWQEPGFAFWFGNFADVMMNLEVNSFVSDFVRNKIKQRVSDPELARALLPDHPFGSKRVPLENGYYEVYNRSNVSLVDLRKTPVRAVTNSGVSTSGGEHSLDAIIYATGFDAGTGALTRIDIRGQGELRLARKWQDGPRTFLGLLVSGFPNLFIVNGPQNAAALCNASRCIEQNVDWIATCIEYMQAHGFSRIDPSAAAEQEWIDHVCAVADAGILGQMKDSWFFGANTPGKARQPAIYAAGAREYRQHCEDVARAGYPGCAMS